MALKSNKYQLQPATTTTLKITPDGLFMRAAALIGKDGVTEELYIWILERENPTTFTTRDFLAAINDQSVPEGADYRDTATMKSGDEMVHIFEITNVVPTT